MAHLVARIAPAALPQLDLLRSVIVVGCALALIAAGQALPYLPF